jgi:hypothetical protein
VLPVDLKEAAGVQEMEDVLDLVMFKRYRM